MSDSGRRTGLAGALIGILVAGVAAGDAGTDRISAPATEGLRLLDFDDPAPDDAAEPLLRLSESLRLALAEFPGELPAATPAAAAAADPAESARTHRLPFLGEAARERGYELPLAFGAGGVYYFLSRGIEVTEVRVGRNGAAVEPVGDFVDLGSEAEVTNANVKFDVWLLPFLNVYAIAGYVWNEADTRLDLTLPPLTPGGAPRRRSVTVPTVLEGSIGGLGVTVAGGYKALFFAGDVNAARADLGFDDKFDAVVSSLRVGWNGKAGERPLRLWLNTTYWDTAAVASGTVADPDGGTLAFEVDQGPIHPWTYGVGAQYDLRPAFNLAADLGFDFGGGWYVAIVPVFRF